MSQVNFNTYLIKLMLFIVLDVPENSRHRNCL